MFFEQKEGYKYQRTKHEYAQQGIVAYVHFVSR